MELISIKFSLRIFISLKTKTYLGKLLFFRELITSKQSVAITLPRFVWTRSWSPSCERSEVREKAIWTWAGYSKNDARWMDDLKWALMQTTKDTDGALTGPGNERTQPVPSLPSSILPVCLWPTPNSAAAAISPLPASARVVGATRVRSLGSPPRSIPFHGGRNQPSGKGPEPSHRPACSC
jgi:hypothetical protein